MDFEILKAAMLASKSTMLKGDDVTTEKMPGKMSPGGGNNAKANEWNFYEWRRLKCVAYWKQFVSRYRLLSVAFFFTFLALMLPFPRLCLQSRASLLRIVMLGIA